MFDRGGISSDGYTDSPAECGETASEVRGGEGGARSGRRAVESVDETQQRDAGVHGGDVEVRGGCQLPVEVGNAHSDGFYGGARCVDSAGRRASLLCLRGIARADYACDFWSETWSVLVDGVVCCGAYTSGLEDKKDGPTAVLLS